MKNLLKVIGLIPSLLSLVKAIEDSISGSGKGAAKLELIREIIMISYIGFNEIWPMLEKVIGAIVRAFNKTETFTATEAPVLINEDLENR